MGSGEIGCAFSLNRTGCSEMTENIMISKVLEKFHSFIAGNPDIGVNQISGNSIMENSKYGFSVKKEQYRYNFNNMSYLDISMEEPVIVEYVSAGIFHSTAGKRLDFHRDYILVYSDPERSAPYHKVYLETLQDINFRRPDSDERESLKSESLLRRLREN